jgi:transcriptional regulator with XRE-family HTH domain
MPREAQSAEGALLRYFRKRKGVTQEELARKAGVSPRTIERWETGFLERERLVEVLGLIGVPPEAVEAGLYADELANPGKGKSSGREDRLIDRATAVGARAWLKAARAEIKASLLRRRAPRDRQWAKERWARLKGLKAWEQEMAVNALLGDERSWALAERICLASTSAAANRADEALRLAGLALRLAEHVSDEDFRPLLLGWVEPFLANAQRVAGDLAASAQTLAHADALWEQGEGCPSAGLLDAARRFDLKASLLTRFGRFEEVHALITKALRGARSPGARGSLYLQKARAFEGAGEYEAALGVLSEAKPHLDAEGDPRLLLSYHFKRAVYHCHLDHYNEAEALLPPVEASIDPKNELDGVRLWWLQGRIAAGLGRRSEAMASLARVRDYFLAEMIAFDFAVVSVELGTLLLESGRAREVRELAEQMKWIFARQGIHQKALEALALFCQAASAEQAQAAWSRQLAKYLYMAQNNPGLKFQP